MKVKVNVEYPDDMTFLYERAADILSDIFIKKLQPSEIDKFIEILQDDNYEINW